MSLKDKETAKLEKENEEREEFLDRKVEVRYLIEKAVILKSEGGKNPEYDRALVELVARVGGLSTNYFPVIRKMIGITEKGEHGMKEGDIISVRGAEAMLGKSLGGGRWLAYLSRVVWAKGGRPYNVIEVEQAVYWRIVGKKI